MKLYNFQKDGVAELHRLFKKNNSVCLSWYTGAGKTNVFCQYIKEYLEKNPEHKVGVSAYLTTEIKEQVTERLQQFGLRDVVQEIRSGKKISTERSVFVFNPQGIYLRNMPFKFDLLVIDESHAGIANECKMSKKIFAENCHENTKYLLASATPWDTLLLEKFENSPVLKRSLDSGIEDGLICDFKFHAEEAKITFDPQDFTREGDVGVKAITAKMSLLKSSCAGKLYNLIARYDKELGDKVLVICPPGNSGEIARSLANEFKGLPFVAWHESGNQKQYDKNLEEFKKNKNVRFIFVIHKCTVGFDMPELTSVVDLTMSRNIKQLAQRIGRVARKHGDLQKRYFYVYDQSLMRDQLDWLLFTLIDFCIGNYDGWSTKTVKYRPTVVSPHWKGDEGILISDVISVLKDPDVLNTSEKLTFVQYTRPTNRTLEQAIEEMKQYPSRHEMFKNDPALYKWFRLHAKKVMDAHFPLRKSVRWNEQKVIEFMKTCEKRRDFHKLGRGARDWLKANGKQDLIEEYLPKPLNKKYNDEIIVQLLSKIRTFSHIRNYPSARKWIVVNGGTEKYRRKWEEIHGKKSNAYSRKAAAG